MAIEGNLDGLFVGADHVVSYTDADNRDMTGWTAVLDLRKKDTSPDPALLSVVGVLTGAYSSTPSVNAQEFLFTLTAGALAATVFTGDDPTIRYSIKRTNAGAKQPLRYGDCPLIRVTQV